MHCITPSERNADNTAMEKRLWDAADQLWPDQQLYDEPHNAIGRFNFVLAIGKTVANRTSEALSSSTSRAGPVMSNY